MSYRDPTPVESPCWWPGCWHSSVLRAPLLSPATLKHMQIWSHLDMEQEPTVSGDPLLSRCLEIKNNNQVILFLPSLQIARFHSLHAKKKREYTSLTSSERRDRTWVKRSLNFVEPQTKCSSSMVPLFTATLLHSSAHLLLFFFLNSEAAKSWRRPVDWFL